MIQFLQTHPSALFSLLLTSLIVIVRLLLLMKEMRDLQIPADSANSYPVIKKNHSYKRTFSDAA
jgi:hypothetical protein